jgi:hypothetical protein
MAVARQLPARGSSARPSELGASADRSGAPAILVSNGNQPADTRATIDIG